MIQRSGDRINPPFYGRYLASHIPAARYFEQPGDHVLRFAAGGDLDVLLAEIEDFLATPGPSADHARVLTTILLAETIGDSKTASSAAQAQGLDIHAQHAARHVRAHRGTVRDSTGRRVLATFDAPGQSIRCAAAMRDTATTLGIQLRIGIHTGEVDLLDEHIAGASVEILERILTQSQPDEILVSRTVKDLVVGSGISFADRGHHDLTVSAEHSPLYAVIST